MINLSKIADLLKHNNIVKNYVYVFFGQNIGSVFSLLSLIITLRLISTENYGYLVIVQAYCLLVSDILSMRTFNGLIKFSTDALANKDYRLVNQYINTSFLLDGVAGVLALIVGYIFIVPIIHFMGWDDSAISIIYLYLPVVLLYPILNGTPVGILRKFGYFKQANIIHVISYGFQLCMLLCLWLCGCKSFKVVIIVYATTEALECLLLLVYSITILCKSNEYKCFWKDKFYFHRDFLQFNLLYGLTTSFDQLLGNISTLILGKYVGNLATGYLRVITRICSLITKFTKPIGQIVYPEICKWISELQFNKALKLSSKYFKYIITFGALLTILLYYTYDLWIDIFDSDMTSAKNQSILYMVYSILSVSIICHNQLVFALNLLKQNLFIVFMANVLYILLLIPIIKEYGVYGYLVLQIIQLLFVFSCKIIIIKRKIKSC